MQLLANAFRIANHGKLQPSLDCLPLHGIPQPVHAAHRLLEFHRLIADQRQKSLLRRDQQALCLRSVSAAKTGKQTIA